MNSENKTTKKSKRRTMTGKVVRRSGDKTVAVEIATVKMHPIYRKRRTERKVYLAHDEKNSATIGEIVNIEESRPLSARKRWVVLSNEKKK